MVSDDPNLWAEKVENEGMWSLTLGTNDRMGGNADFGYQSVFGETEMFKDDEFDVLVQDPLMVRSSIKVGEEEYEAERSDAGFIDKLKGDTTETRMRDVKEDVLVTPRAKDIFQDRREATRMRFSLTFRTQFQRITSLTPSLTVQEVTRLHTKE
jgi:hypothetical protein